MTKPLPNSVEINPARQGPARLTASEREALATIKDVSLRKLIGEILRASHQIQANFDEVGEWFPVQPQDVASAVLEDQAHLAVRYLFSAALEGNPGEGFFRLNNANPEEATKLRINGRELSGVLISSYLSHWTDSTNGTSKAQLEIRSIVNPAIFWIFEVTGTVTEPGFEVWEFPVILRAKGIGAISEDDEVAILFGRTGDKGEKGEKGEKGTAGEKGEKGSTGEAGSDAGLKYTYLTNVENTDPGAGKLKFDKATLAEATSLRISETDGDANALAAYLATLDDSTNAVRGHIILRKVGSATAFAIFSVTGALTDNGTWDSLVVTHVVSNGLANNDVVRLQFYRVGDKGEKGEKGATGEKGEKGSTGDTGQSEAFVWNWHTGGAPGSGQARVSGGKLEVHRTPASGPATLEKTLKRWNFGLLTVRRLGVANAATVYKVVGPGELKSNVWIVPVVELDSEGELDEHEVSLGFDSSITDWGLVSALPEGASVGDQCSYYADKTNGIIWRFIYDGEGEFPWKKIGGRPLAARSDVLRELTNKLTYTSLPTDPLKITVPLAGDYDVRCEFKGRPANIATEFVVYSYAVGATAASDNWGLIVQTPSAGFNTQNPANGTRHTEVAKGAVIEEKARTSGNFTGVFAVRRLWVDPVRVK